MKYYISGFRKKQEFFRKKLWKFITTFHTELVGNKLTENGLMGYPISNGKNPVILKPFGLPETKAGRNGE